MAKADGTGGNRRIRVGKRVAAAGCLGHAGGDRYFARPAICQRLGLSTPYTEFWASGPDDKGRRPSRRVRGAGLLVLSPGLNPLAVRPDPRRQAAKISWGGFTRTEYLGACRCRLARAGQQNETKQRPGIMDPGPDPGRQPLVRARGQAFHFCPVDSAPCWSSLVCLLALASCGRGTF